jgi:hypothetical protein
MFGWFPEGNLREATRAVVNTMWCAALAFSFALWLNLDALDAFMGSMCLLVITFFANFCINKSC